VEPDGAPGSPVGMTAERVPLSVKTFPVLQGSACPHTGLLVGPSPTQSCFPLELSGSLKVMIPFGPEKSFPPAATPANALTPVGLIGNTGGFKINGITSIAAFERSARKYSTRFGSIQLMSKRTSGLPGTVTCPADTNTSSPGGAADTGVKLGTASSATTEAATPASKLARPSHTRRIGFLIVISLFQILSSRST